MTLVVGSKADLVKRQLTEYKTLGANFAITADLPSYEDVTGMSVLLPFPGNYILSGNIEGVVTGSSGTEFGITVRAYNKTLDEAVADSGRLVVYQEDASHPSTATINYWHVVSVNKPTTMQLQVGRGAAVGATWTLSILVGAPAAPSRTQFGYLQLV